MNSGAGIDDKEQQVRFADGVIDLLADLDVHWRALVVVDATGVHQPEAVPRPLGLGEIPVASGSRLLGDNGRVLADDAIEKLGLPDIRPADDSYYRCGAQAATPLSACVDQDDGSLSTSMKS